MAAVAVFAGLLTSLGGVAGAAPTVTAQDPAPQARTATGVFVGGSDGTVDTFSGIRYARPPLGNLRFAPAAPAPPSSAVTAANRPGVRCVQTPGASTASEGEDCLTLNVTRPTGETGPLPVIVYWHGGGFTRGAGSNYDTSRMTSRGRVVVVTINYRLGDLGYLSLPGLSGGGNFGLTDQLESLRWLRRNAGAFGGDPGNITISGASAGALSVCAALASPVAAGLFDRAISSSGACATAWAAGTLGRGTLRQFPFASRAGADQAGVSRATSLGCSGTARLACLRGKPASAFTRPGPAGRVVYPVAYGTPWLPKHPFLAQREGAINKVPVLSGTNRDEARGVIGIAHGAKPYTAAEYTALLKAFGTNSTRVAQAYPLSKYTSPAAAWAAVATDSGWACPTLTGNRATAAVVPTYAYEFSDPDTPVAGPPVANFPFGAIHSGDLQYLFGGSPTFTPAQRVLGDTMIAYWTAFARTGDPNTDDLAPLPRFERDGPTTSLAPGDNGIRPVDLGADHRCALWSTVPF